MTDRETTINYLQGDETMTVFSSQKKWVNKLTKASLDNNSGVRVTHVNTDGSKQFEVPVSWLKISPPRRISEEQKQAAAERMKKLTKKCK